MVTFLAVTNTFATELLFLQEDNIILQQQHSRQTTPEQADTLLLLPGKTGSAKGQYMAFFSLGLLPGSMDIIQTTPLSLGMSQGYYRHGVFIGGGMAVENFQPAFLPVYADVRFFLFPKSPVCPWIKLMLGKNFLFPGIAASSDQGIKDVGRVVAGTGVGVSYRMGNYASFYFYLGYRNMGYTEKRTDYYQNPVRDVYTFKRMEFRIGFNF